MTFLTETQSALAEEIATLLTTRSEKVAVAESSAGGLISAALLHIPGASRYYAGGGVVYTLASRTQLAGSDPALYENYTGTTPEMLTSLAESMRSRLDATWCIAESGLAGPTGSTRSTAPVGRTALAVAGPITRSELFETGLDDRPANMSEFTTLALRFLRDAIAEA